MDTGRLLVRGLRMIKGLSLLVTSLSFLSVSYQARGDLIRNGSFESYEVDPILWTFPDAADLDVALGSADITDWTVINGTIDYVSDRRDINLGWPASDGNRSLDLAGNPGSGGVSQTFTTFPGVTYRVKLDISGNPDPFFGEPTLKTLRVQAASQSADFSFDVAAEGNNFDDMKWRSHEFFFTADDGATTLEIFSTLPVRFTGPVLDNVSVSPVPYSCVGFVPPFDVALLLQKNVKRTIPVKMVLIDDDDNIIGDQDLPAPPVINVVFDPSNNGPAADFPDDLLPQGVANEDNYFRFDADTETWIYNLGTKHFDAPGTYEVTVAPGDPTYDITTCRQTFERLD